MVAEDAVAEMDIAAIVVGDRARRDVGDLTQLKASIAGVGLLHPIVVNNERRLVAGGRRLEACRELGWTSIPVTVVHALGDASKALEAERDENVCRLDMKPSEKVALGKKLEAIHAPHVKELRREKTSGANHWRHRKDVSVNVTEASKTPQTRDVIGAAIGLSGVSYARAKAVIELAASGDPVAIEAAAEMDKTGKITPAYTKATGRPTAPKNRAKRTPRVPLKEALAPLHKWLRDWTPEKLKGTTPAQARTLLAMTSETRDALFEVERALSERTVVSRALR